MGESEILDGIAVIGLSGRFPGARDVEEFWANLCQGRESIRSLSGRELRASGVSPSLYRRETYVKAAPILEDVEFFDADFFDCSPREARLMDPQHRLLLECAWEALEVAGYDPQRYGGAIGVYCGAGGAVSSYLVSENHLHGELLGPTGSLGHLGNDKDYIPTRISFKLGLTGPSIAVQTACSTSLVAVHLACQSLFSGECDMALAGGVAVRVPHRVGYVSEEGGIVSPDGHCRTFDAEARGTVFGSGAGLVLLKPLAAAVEDGDAIRAVIRGSAVNNDGGAKVSFTASSARGQSEAIAEALAVAEVDAGTVSYVEAHGTATLMGDPVEVAALTRAFRTAGAGEESRCGLGSVKSNIGHLESAAGVAGLIKTVLSLERRTLPPSLHYDTPNPRIDFESSPFFVVDDLVEWEEQDHPRRAGVNSLGLGGTNAFVVLEEAPARAPAEEPAQAGDEPRLLTLSAKSEEALASLAGRYASHLAAHPELDLGNVCFTAHCGRAQFGRRAAVAAGGTEEMVAGLTALSQGETPSGTVRGTAAAGSSPKVAFLFSGQGSQYLGMGRQLYRSQPVFRRALDRCAEILDQELDTPLLEVLFPAEEASTRLDETAFTQPALFACEWALAELWRSWGVRPAAVLGHSVGEYVAATVAGVMELDDALRLIARRARAMGELPAGGAMAAVYANAETVETALEPYEDRLSIAAFNGPTNLVVSGQEEALAELLAELGEAGVRSKRLTVSHAFHSPLIELALETFEPAAAEVSYRAPDLPWVSNLTGRPAEEAPDADYWVRHCRRPVRFAESIASLVELEIDVLLEVGPQATLAGMAKRCLESRDEKDGAIEIVPSLRKGKDDRREMLQALGGLWSAGVEIDWDASAGKRRRRVPLPTYPFQRSRHWVDESAAGRPGMGAEAEARHPLLGQRVESPLAAIQFATQLRSDAVEWLGGQRLYGTSVLPLAAVAEMAYAAQDSAPQHCGNGAGVELSWSADELLTLPDGETRSLQFVLHPAPAGQDEASEASAVRFELFHRGEEAPAGSAWSRGASGEMRPARGAARAVDLGSVGQRCHQELDAEERDLLLSELGLSGGLEGVEGLRRRDGEVLAELEQSATAPWRAAAGGPHPAMLEAAFQVLRFALPEAGANSGELTVLNRVEGLRILGPLPERVLVHARLTDRDASGFAGTMQLLDPSGRPLVEARELRFATLDRQAMQRAAQENLEELLYQIRWQPQPAPAVSAPTDSERRAWLLFVDRTGVGSALAARLELDGHRVLRVEPGERFEAVGAGGRAAARFTIDPCSRADVERLLEQAASGSDLPLGGVIHLWSLDAGTRGEDAIRPAEDLGAVNALLVVQALVAQRAAEGPRLWMVTRGAQPAPATDALAALQSPVWGMGRVIALEHPEVWGGLVDLDLRTGCEPADGGVEREEIESLLTELARPDREDQVAYRQGERYAPRLRRRDLESGPREPLELSADASYLITGGLGGLGLAVARFLVERGARHLVLLGRRGLPPRADWDRELDSDGPAAKAIEQVRALEAAGAVVQPVAADVADRTALRTLFEELDQGPGIRGVVHAAGVLQPTPSEEIDVEELRAMMRPKTSGAWALHELTLGMDLDFFILFSSAATMWGAKGLAHYAAANHFLDILAHHRAALGLPALAVNWGPWAGDGMAALQDQSWLARIGVAPLAPEEALAALECLLQDRPPQATVARVDWNLFRRAYETRMRRPALEELETRASSGPELPKVAPVSLSARLAEAPVSKRRGILDDFVREAVMAVLGLAPEAAFDPTKGLFDSGLDSLMALDLTRHLESGLGEDIRLSSTLALDYPTAEAIAGHLDSLLSDGLPSDGATPDATEEPQPTESAEGALEPLPQSPPGALPDAASGDEALARWLAENEARIFR